MPTNQIQGIVRFFRVNAFICFYGEAEKMGSGFLFSPLWVSDGHNLG